MSWNSTAISTNSIEGLAGAVRSFSEAWLIEGDIEKAVAYMSDASVHSRGIIEMIKNQKKIVTPEVAKQVFADSLRSWRDRIEPATTLSEAIEAVPAEPLAENIRLSGEESEWYTIFKVNEAAARELAWDEPDAQWLIQQSKKQNLYAQAFRFKRVRNGENDSVTVFIWRREGSTWKILAVGAVRM